MCVCVCIYNIIYVSILGSSSVYLLTTSVLIANVSLCLTVHNV